MNVSFNVTALRDNVLYRRDINTHFYRSCYKEGKIMIFFPTKLFKQITIIIFVCRCVGG